jgi:hypothetical protein
VKHLALAGLALLPLVVQAQSAPSSDELAARIKAMAEIPSTFSAAYSRDGKRIAFLSNRSGTPQVWVVDAAGGEPQQITQGTDPVGSVEWSPVEDRLAYDVARGGGYNTQVFYARPDGSDAKRITSGGKEDNFAGSFAPDGRYFYRSAQRDPQSPDSWIYDPKTGQAAIAIQYDGGFGYISDIQRPANRALVERLVTRGNTNVFLHDLQTRRPRARLRRARAGRQRGLHRPQPRARPPGRIAHSDRCRRQAGSDDDTRRARRRRSG